MSNKLIFAFCLLAAILIPQTALAWIPYSDANYNDAVDKAETISDSPTGWLPTDGSIITIPTPGASGHGLTYDTYNSQQYLITRTLTNVSFYFNSGTQTMTGIGPYKTFDVTPTQNKNASWMTTGDDATNFIDDPNNGVTPANVIKSLEKSIGVPDNAAHTAYVEYAIVPLNEYLMRPSRNPDITSYDSTHPENYGYYASFPVATPSGMTDATYTRFKAYYNYWYGYNFGDPHAAPPTDPTSASYVFPWLQAGYTFLWGPDQSSLAAIQGSSEFIILGGTGAWTSDSVVYVYGIYSPQSYLYTKNNGQYGNGYASFNINGSCDTVWAGDAFQKRVSATSASPNEITITSAGSVSGGQGILVWSLNYNVSNYGTISGATALKLADAVKASAGMTGTGNIAVLFKGDTSFGAPPAGSVNRLTNSGTISSPGIGVKVESGDSIITNNAGGTISGTTAAISIAAGSTTITNRGTITGDIALAAGVTGSLDIGNTALTVTDGYLSALTFTANSSTDFGNLTTTGTSVDASSTVNVTVGGYIPNGTPFQVISTGAGITAVPSTITPSSPIFTFSGDNSTNNLILTATRARSYNSFASNSNTTNLGSVLNTLAMNNTATGDMVNILGALDSLTSGSTINQALGNMAPNMDNSSTQTSQATMNQFLSTVFAHLDAFKNVTSDALKGPDVWASGFASYIHQDPRDTSNGYNATVWGTALGLDILALDNLRLGPSGGFAQDFVRTKDSSSRTDINSYQGALYGSYAKDAYYIDSAVSFAYNTYDTSRTVTIGALNRTATGDYNGQQYSAYIGGGYKFTAKNIELTPLASFQYTHLRLNGYTESGAGAADLKVDPQDYDVAQTGLGMKLGYPLDLGAKTGRLTPELKFKWLYDWVGDAQQSTAAFTGGGGSFGTKGFTPAQSSYDFGAKVTLETVNFITLSLNYDFELKEDFFGHYGVAEVRYRF